MELVGFGGPKDWSYCTASAPCKLGQGDCDSDKDCSGSLVCGTDNCQDFTAQALNSTDCCMELVGFGGPKDWSYCTASAPCKLGQGDCDSDKDCSGSLVCGTDNCQDFTAQARNDTDCCMNPGPGTSKKTVAPVTNIG